MQLQYTQIMATLNKTQIQVRIDRKTKNGAKKVLESLGLDISSAVKVFLRQVHITGTFPLEIRDANGLSKTKANELRESIKDAEKSNEIFSSVKTLMKDLKS